MTSTEKTQALREAYAALLHIGFNETRALELMATGQINPQLQDVAVMAQALLNTEQAGDNQLTPLHMR